MKTDKSLEIGYERISRWAQIFVFHFVPFLRRCVRFMALPYCYTQVNWDLCTRSRIGVCVDFLYIFFVLKYYPDNYSPCRLWEKPRSEWKYYYGSNYDPYQRKQLQRTVQPPEYEIIFKDKWINNALCQQAGIPTPEILSRIKPGELLEQRIDDLFSADETLSELVIKPVDGKGGGGVIWCNRQHGENRFLQGQEAISLSGVISEKHYIVQPFIQQHPVLTRVAKSTNTIRIVTLLQDSGEVLIIGAFMRFGTGESRIDNTSQGGLCVPIDSNCGKLLRAGNDHKSQIYEEHPDSKIVFEDIEIPHWQKVVELASSIQCNFLFYRLLGMDIAIGYEGPILIEVNSNYDNVGLEQAIGPILKSKLVAEAYSRLGLLINRHQKRISSEVGAVQ